MTQWIVTDECALQAMSGRKGKGKSSRQAQGGDDSDDLDVSVVVSDRNDTQDLLTLLQTQNEKRQA